MTARLLIRIGGSNRYIRRFSKCFPFHGSFLNGNVIIRYHWKVEEDSFLHKRRIQVCSFAAGMTSVKLNNARNF